MPAIRSKKSKVDDKSDKSVTTRQRRLNVPYDLAKSRGRETTSETKSSRLSRGRSVNVSMSILELEKIVKASRTVKKEVELFKTPAAKRKSLNNQAKTNPPADTLSNQSSPSSSSYFLRSRGVEFDATEGLGEISNKSPEKESRKRKERASSRSPGRNKSSEIEVHSLETPKKLKQLSEKKNSKQSTEEHAENTLAVTITEIKVDKFFKKTDQKTNKKDDDGLMKITETTKVRSVSKRKFPAENVEDESDQKPNKKPNKGDALQKRTEVASKVSVTKKNKLQTDDSDGTTKMIDLRRKNQINQNEKKIETVVAERKLSTEDAVDSVGTYNKILKLKLVDIATDDHAKLSDKINLSSTTQLLSTDGVERRMSYRISKKASSDVDDYRQSASFLPQDDVDFAAFPVEEGLLASNSTISLNRGNAKRQMLLTSTPMPSSSGFLLNHNLGLSNDNLDVPPSVSFMGGAKKRNRNGRQEEKNASEENIDVKNNSEKTKPGQDSRRVRRRCSCRLFVLILRSVFICIAVAIILYFAIAHCYL